MKNTCLLIITVFTIACNPGQQKSDAYGNFEATEIRVSAMAAGKLIYLNIQEGIEVVEGEVLGQIDTVHLYLRKEHFKAAYQAALSRKPGIVTQINVLQEQKDLATKDLERFRRLAEDGAVAHKQADDLADRIAVLDKQIKNIDAQNGPLISELKVIETQIAQIDQQIMDSKIIAPFTGIILTQLAEPHELVSMGSPLFRLANLDTLTLKAYIGGTQLNEIKLGQQVEILIDKDRKTFERFPGTISWIASTAEFTPKTIQTKNERTDQVYAIKIKAPNPEGIMKIGMPGEVLFSTH
jgi:HlyD family secretion protein